MAENTMAENTMLLCSPTRLCMDLHLWSSEGFPQYCFSLLKKSDENTYDCALLSVPCESNITKEVFSFDASAVFWFDVIIVHCLIGMLVPVGIIGNILNIIILSKHNIVNDSTNSLLLGLAVSDLMSMLCIGLVIICGYLCFIDVNTAINVYMRVFYYTIVFSRYLSILSLDFVAAIGVQRAAGVIVPFKVKTIFSQRNTNLIIAGIVFAFFSFIPTLTGFSQQYVYHPYFGETVPLGYLNEWPYQRAVDHFTVARGGLGLLVILVFGSLTVFKLKVQARHRASLKASTSSSSRDAPKMSASERKVITMSLTVSCISFVVYSFSVTNVIIIQVFSEVLFRNSAYCVLNYTLSFVFAMNSSVNFFTYFSMSAKYRESCKTLLSRNKWAIPKFKKRYEVGNSSIS